MSEKSLLGNSLWLLTVVLLGSIHVAEAQQIGKAPRVGFLLPGYPSAYSINLEAFRQGLRDLGYIEGKNIAIAVEYRYLEKNVEQIADDLLRLNLDVIVTTGTAATRAMKQATNTTPIVMAAVGDALKYGLVTSLARPGGNITGLSFLSPEVRGKQLELLKEAFPKMSRVIVFRDPSFAPESLSDLLAEAEMARGSLGLDVQNLDVRGPEEFERAFKAAAEKRADALLIRANPLFRANLKRFTDLAAKSRVPTMYPWREFVETGGLLTYGPSLEHLWRRAAIYVDKILKGAKPGDLPIEQPTKFELVINLKTAKQIGLTIPPNVLARADKVIR